MEMGHQVELRSSDLAGTMYYNLTLSQEIKKEKQKNSKCGTSRDFLQLKETSA
jgi:hypothetical protein